MLRRACLLAAGQSLAQAAADRRALVHLAVADSDAQLKLAQFHNAAEAAVRGLDVAGQAGSWGAQILAANAAEALLALGRTGEAAALIDPLTPGAPDRDNWVVHRMRGEIDLLRGNVRAAEQRQQLFGAITARIGGEDHAREAAQRAAELALWAGRPGDALGEVRRVLPLFKTPDLTVFSGRLLAAGMRACADLAGQARARRDLAAAEGAAAAADGLASWVERMGGAPFTDHPWVATIPAERGTWDAERARVAGDTDPAAWAAAAKTWDGLGCPHPAAYAWWRQAQAHLDAGQPPTIAAAALRSAAAAAGGHTPLLAQIRLLAERARIPLDAPAATAGTPAPYGLTGRELAVLRLVAAGRSNAQIGAELFISPRTAGVHVTNILRKLGVTNRVQAAALAEHAGLLDTPSPKHRRRESKDHYCTVARSAGLPMARILGQSSHRATRGGHHAPDDHERCRETTHR
jgi:DNA-binding CsgD family transcriptional regulator